MQEFLVDGYFFFSFRLARQMLWNWNGFNVWIIYARNTVINSYTRASSPFSFSKCSRRADRRLFTSYCATVSYSFSSQQSLISTSVVITYYIPLAQWWKPSRTLAKSICGLGLKDLEFPYQIPFVCQCVSNLLVTYLASATNVTCLFLLVIRITRIQA